MDKLTPSQILNAGLADWRQLGDTIRARFKTGDFVTGLRFVTAVAEASEAAGHHPDVTLSYPRVDLSLISHDAGALTQRDVDLARTISRIAAEQGIGADPAGVHLCILGLDTADSSRIGPFWAAVLADLPEAYADGMVVDASGQSPLLWFQPTEEHEPPRQRFHIDLLVGHDAADQRIAAAVAAGGVIVDDSHAPAFTVLADPDGNKACICTALEE